MEEASRMSLLDNMKIPRADGGVAGEQGQFMTGGERDDEAVGRIAVRPVQFEAGEPEVRVDGDDFKTGDEGQTL